MESYMATVTVMVYNPESMTFNLIPKFKEHHKQYVCLRKNKMYMCNTCTNNTCKNNCNDTSVQVKQNKHYL